jgi:hypothetical protein
MKPYDVNKTNHLPLLSSWTFWHPKWPYTKTHLTLHYNNIYHRSYLCPEDILSSYDIALLGCRLPQWYHMHHLPFVKPPFMLSMYKLYQPYWCLSSRLDILHVGKSFVISLFIYFTYDLVNPIVVVEYQF